MNVQAFERDGYLVVPGVLDDRMLDSLLLFIKNEEGPALKQAAAELGVTTYEALLARAEELCGTADERQVSMETRRIVSGFIRQEARLAPLLVDLCCSQALRSVLQPLFPRERLHAHYPPAARFVRPGNRLALIGAHRDRTYNAHLKRLVVAWIPLVDVDFECGGVAVYPRPDDFWRDPEIGGTGYWIYQAPLNTSGMKPTVVSMDAGDILLLNQDIVHESVPNCSARTRYSISIRYFGDAFDPVKHYVDVRTRTVHAPGEGTSAEKGSVGHSGKNADEDGSTS